MVGFSPLEVGAILPRTWLRRETGQRLSNPLKLESPGRKALTQRTPRKAEKEKEGQSGKWDRTIFMT